MKRIIFLLLMTAGIAVFSIAQTDGSGAYWGEAPVMSNQSPAGTGGGFLQEGIASWYGSEFDGKPTASGEIFNSELFTAAHPALPFGTVVTITNKQNNKRVTVRINDRGPFVAARIIDLSKAAAEVLDMLVTGTAPVIIESSSDNIALGPASEAPPAEIAYTAPQVTPQPLYSPPQFVEVPLAPIVPQESAKPAEIPAPVYTPAPMPVQPLPPAPPVHTPPPVQPHAPAPVPQMAPPVMYPAPPAKILGGIPPAGSTKYYRLQVGAFRIPRNAVEAFDRLKNAGLKPAYEQYGDLYRVVLAGLRAVEIPSIAQTLGNTGFPEAIIREETGH